MSKRTMSLMKKCSPIFSMLQDERRQEILILLFDTDDLSVTELAARLSLSRPAVSHHLKLLLDANLLSCRKSGKERYYRLELNSALELLNLLSDSIANDIRVKNEQRNATV